MRIIGRHLLLNKEGDNGSGGSGASGGNAGAAPNAGSGSLTAGGDGNSGAGAAPIGAPAGASGSGNPTEIKIPDNWKSSLPQELQEDPALKAINDVGSLAKSYVSAQKLVGAEKIVVPGKFATDEDWKAVYTKLGLPTKAEDYKVDVGQDAAIDAKFLDAFKSEAFKIGILPQQATKLAQWFDATNKNISKDINQSQTAFLEKQAGELQKDWGEAYNTKLTRAQAAFKHFADADTIAYLDKTGLATDAKLIKLFEKISTVLDEDKIPKGAASTGSIRTPSEAKQEIGRIMADPNHAYHLRDHPNHKIAVDEVSKLFVSANNGKT